MFKDYYEILEVDCTATIAEIKAAFKQQALKWHPDRNQDKDTTKRMQDINEAHLILKDEEARERYDKTYSQFKNMKEHIFEQNMENEKEDYEYSYFVNDDILLRWMNNAKRQAVDLAKQTIKDLKVMSNAGANEFIKEGSEQLFYQIIISIGAIIVFAIIRSCK
jgi:curved DNA-binding protein CbpA